MGRFRKIRKRERKGKRHMNVRARKKPSDVFVPNSFHLTHKETEQVKFYQIDLSYLIMKRQT